MRVKTPMGLERFEVGKISRPIYKSLEIYEGVNCGAEKKLCSVPPGLMLDQNQKLI